MEHTENNILIAEFMGLEFRTLKNLDIKQVKLNTNSIKSWTNINNLQYNKSWDWLMPVVEQIKNIGTHSETSDGEYTLLDNIDDALIVVRIDLVYLAVIDFIKWHNKNLDRL